VAVLFHPDLVPIYMWLFNLYDSDLLDTLAEGRSKVRDAKEASVVVVGADFLAGVKTEGVASMLKQVKSLHDGCFGIHFKPSPVVACVL
jgi:hypothetical protein